MALSTEQLKKAGKTLLLFRKTAKELDTEKPFISLRGILKGVKISEKRIKAARHSLFKKYR